MDVDVVCVGFGPAAAGFLTTLSRGLVNDDGTPAVESAVMPGLPLQVTCFERADDIGTAVSGVVTRARAIRETFPDLDPSQIPMAAPVHHEQVAYLLDPVGASRRSATLQFGDRMIRAAARWLKVEHDALPLPYIPDFLRKDGGLVLSLGQFMQWVGGHVMASGVVQVWPGTPVKEALVDGTRVVGVRLVDQGTDRHGAPEAGFMPGMDVRAALTVVADGPVGAVGRQLDEQFGMPAGHHVRDWAVGMKMVVDLREDSGLQPGTVLHTFGYPEPEIFGFLYVNDARTASLGIFVPSWFDSPVRTAYRYLQHWMLHPYLWRYLQGGRMRSWGAKSLQESGKRGEPFLVGDGYARIGEGSGSTNVLTGSGVDEAWLTGSLLAKAVLDLASAGTAFTKDQLTAAYVRRRRESWVEHEGIVAERARDGFHRGVITGLIGMGLAGLSGGRLFMPVEPRRPHERVRPLEQYFADRIPASEVARIRAECQQSGLPLHDALLERAGWPTVPYDGALLVSHQDALLMGGKVQAASGYADHVMFEDPALCRACQNRLCIEICSGQALMPGADDVPAFDREKCIHCGACFWSCTQHVGGHPDRMNLVFRAGSGGLHSTEN
ncbi:MAG: 4Fe-4S ferredoxin [Acidobacteria bacterium]|nr:4Fe-4S ferredoxin [Acidobacteriota bacterium]